MGELRVAGRALRDERKAEQRHLSLWAVVTVRPRTVNILILSVVG